MKQQFTAFLIFVCTLFFLFSPVNDIGYAQSDTITIIVNKSLIPGFITSNDIKNIFLGKKKNWGDGQKVNPAILKKGPLHENFVKKYTKKNESQFWTYWQRQMFTGKGVPPKSFDTENELIAYVAKTKGAIGYISCSKKSNSVKCIKVSEK